MYHLSHMMPLSDGWRRLKNKGLPCFWLQDVPLTVHPELDLSLRHRASLPAMDR
jgi:hypothetical protein